MRRIVFAAVALLSFAACADLAGLAGGGAPREGPAGDASMDAGDVTTLESGPGDAAPDVVSPCDAALATDPANCGACGRSCLGGACDAGMCPVTLLTTGEDSPVNIVVDDANAYITTSRSNVRLIAKDGASVRDLTTGFCGGLGIAIDATNVYFAGYPCDAGAGSLSAVEKSNGLALNLVTAVAPNGVAVTSDRVVYVDALDGDAGSGTVNAFLLSTRASAVLERGLDNPFAIHVDPTSSSIYWTELGPVAGAGRVRRAPIAGDMDSGSLVAQGLASPSGVTTDAMNVYFVDQSIGLLSLPLGASGPANVLARIAGIRRVVVDGEHLYFAAFTNDLSTDGALYRSRLDGSELITLARARGAAIRAVAVDASYAYFTSIGTISDGGVVANTGSVSRTPK